MHHAFLYVSLPFFERLRRLVSCFMEDVNKQRRNFVSLPELEYGPLEFKFRRVRNFTFAVATLNLKVPYGTMSFLVPITLKRVLRMLMLYVFQSEMFT